MAHNVNVINIVIELTDNFTKILSKNELQRHPKLKLSGNGTGDRWANKKFNYTVIYSTGITRTYSENTENDYINDTLLNAFLENYRSVRNSGSISSIGNSSGIIGIFVHSVKQNIETRNIRANIKKEIKSRMCAMCDSYKEVECDHKNDLYNDKRVLILEEQSEEDFQPLCRRCNLQKRQHCIKEKETNKLYSGKQSQRYRSCTFEFPWEKKNFDINDPDCKKDTFWYDILEFDRKVHLYSIYWPIIKKIKCRKKGRGIKVQYLLDVL
uniref:HNH nuclease domain-containing protein n=1 Tax=viral metagenome TaxID=1070528 RepID=A0A6C0I0G6_9ZZZZ